MDHLSYQEGYARRLAQASSSFTNAIMPQLDYSNYVYLAVTFSSASPSTGSAMTSIHPALSCVGQVGQLKDVQLYSIPKTDWQHVNMEIMQAVKESDGVLRVDIQQPQLRAKRGGDELWFDVMSYREHISFI